MFTHSPSSCLPAHKAAHVMLMLSDRVWDTDIVTCNATRSASQTYNSALHVYLGLESPITHTFKQLQLHDCKVVGDSSYMYPWNVFVIQFDCRPTWWKTIKKYMARMPHMSGSLPLWLAWHSIYSTLVQQISENCFYCFIMNHGNVMWSVKVNAFFNATFDNCILPITNIHTRKGNDWSHNQKTLFCPWGWAFDSSNLTLG